MKTEIIIKGNGIRSISTLRSAITVSDCSIKKLRNHSLLITYKTKKAATDALSLGFRRLASDAEDWKASMGDYARGSFLNYDAACAYVVEQ